MSPWGLRPVVHKTQSHNDLRNSNSPTIGETIVDPDETPKGIKAIKIVRCKSLTGEPIMRKRDTDFENSSTDVDVALLRELHTIKTLMANVMEVSPRGAQFERLMSRADAQVGNANAAISRIVLLDKNMTEMLKNMHKILEAIKKSQIEEQLMLHTCLNRIDFLEGSILDMHRIIKQDSKMLHAVFEMLVEQESSSKLRENDARIANIEAMLLAIGKLSDNEE